jgi:hypothetical protein
MNKYKSKQKTLKIRNLISNIIILILSYQLFILFTKDIETKEFIVMIFMAISAAAICGCYTISLYRFTHFKKEHETEQLDIIMDIVSDARKNQNYTDLNQMLFEQPIKTCWVIGYKFNKSLIDFSKIRFERTEWMINELKEMNLEYEDLSKEETTWLITNKFFKDVQKLQKNQE